MALTRSQKLSILAFFKQYYRYVETDEDVLIKLLKEKRRSSSKMFKLRDKEGIYNILIKKRLHDNGEEFKAYFRFTPDQFTYLLSLVEQKLKTASCNRVSKPITPAEKLALTLRYLVTGESYGSLKSSHRISVSEISKTIPKVLKALKEELLHKFLPPPDQIDWRKKAEEFWDCWNFPNAVAAISGKHVRVVAPNQTGNSYYNCKGDFSVVLLALIDANYSFIIVDIGFYGQEGDVGIFNKSKMAKLIRDGSIFPPSRLLPQSDLLVPHVVLGDETFRLDEHIMKPYRKQQATEDAQKSKFNNKLSQVRRIADITFAIMCSTFRILFTPINVLPETADDIISVCCCLHNFLRQEHFAKHPLLNDNDNELDNFVLPRNNMIPMMSAGGFAKASGFSVREQFTNYFSGTSFEGL